MNQKPLYVVLAGLVSAYKRCVANPKQYGEWKDKHEERILALVKEHLPSGSGFNIGTQIDLGRSTGEKLIFNTAYHHMNECGMYDGWTEHTVTVRPSFEFGFTFTTSGRSRNEIKVKDYASEVFDLALRVGVPEYLSEEPEPAPTEADAHTCAECGHLFGDDDSPGVLVHRTEDGSVDYDLDRDHVPVAPPSGA